MRRNNDKCQFEPHTLFGVKILMASFVLAGTVLTSCRPNAYLPNTIHTPLLKEKGEIRATLNTSNVQLAYAVTENIGIMANGQYSTMRQTTTSGNEAEKDVSTQTVGEIGVGYFSPFGANGVFEVYSGGGYGQVHIHSTLTGSAVRDYDRTLNTFATKFFLQPSLGFSNTPFDLAFTPRITGMIYGNRTLDGYPVDELTKNSILASDGLDKLEGLHMFFEPGLTFRVGFKWVKLQTQVFYVGQFIGEKTTYIPLQIHFGLHVNIANRYME